MLQTNREDGEDLLPRSRLCRRPDHGGHRPQVPRRRGGRRRHLRRPHRRLEQRRAPDLRAGPRRRRAPLPREEPLLQQRRREARRRGRHRLRLREHPHQGPRPRRRQGRRPHLLGERGADDRRRGDVRQGRRREVHRAGQDRGGHREDPRPQRPRRRRLPDPLQPGVPRRGHRHPRPARPRPRPHRRPRDRRGARRRPGAQGRVHPMGPRGEDPHHQPLVRRAVQARRQRVPGPEDLVRQRHVRALRGHRRRRRRGRLRRGQGLQDRRQVSQRQRGIRWLLLPERHPQPAVHLRVQWPPRGGQLLEAGDQGFKSPAIATTMSKDIYSLTPFQVIRRFTSVKIKLFQVCLNL